MSRLTINTACAEQTFNIGSRLGRLIPAGTVLAVRGELGAGKTVLAAGIAAGLGITDTVTSPTYIIANEYAGRIPFCHVDAYRLDGLSQEELALSGVEDFLHRDKACLVEWPDFIADFLPRGTINVTITADGNYRELVFDYDEEGQGWLNEAIGD